MTDDPRRLAHVTFLYDSLPTVDVAAVVARAAEAVPGARVMMDEPESFAISHTEVTSQDDGGRAIPVQTVGFLDSGKGPTMDFSQSWAADADLRKRAEACTSRVLLAELMPGQLAAADRVRCFLAVASALLELAPPVAVWGGGAGHLLSPDDATELGERMLVGVRAFRDGDDFVADTLGLDILGVSDLQCRFHDLPLADVLSHLMAIAMHQIEYGDVIQEGDAVGGIKQAPTWTAHYEGSLADPPRLVIDLDPGAPFSPDAAAH